MGQRLGHKLKQSNLEIKLVGQTDCFINKFLHLVSVTCDWVNLAIWATLGYFLLNQFLPKPALSAHGLLWVL
jgi:hypothetical protein